MRTFRILLTILILSISVATVMSISDITDAATRVSTTEHAFEVNGTRVMYIDATGTHNAVGLFPRIVDDTSMDGTLGMGPGELVYNLDDSKMYVHINANTPALGAQYWSALN